MIRSFFFTREPAWAPFISNLADQEVAAGARISLVTGSCETLARCASVALKGARRRHPFGTMLRIAISALRALSAT
jgi:hypothetical protein